MDGALVRQSMHNICPPKKRIRVLECIRQGQIGGGESHLLSLIENLDTSRFEPTVLSFTDGPMIDKLNSMGVPNTVICTTRPFDITKWKQIKAFIKENEFDLIHTHGTRAASNLIWAARSLKIPLVYTIHGWSFHQDQNWFIRKMRILGEKYLTAKTHLNISVSKSNQLSGKQHIKSLESIVISNGIDSKRFNPDKKHTDIRRELSIPNDSILILFIARFTSHKQPLRLIQSFLDARKSNKDLHLLMVGDGDQKEEAILLIKKHKLEKCITLLPFRHDVPEVLAAADIFVLPSLWEGLPIGLLEAMSMRKAVIATDVDGTSEIVKNRYNGILIDTNDLQKSLTGALLELSSDASMRKELGSKAFDTVHEKYDALKMTRSIEDVYTSLIS